jgi:hypothetical protein
MAGTKETRGGEPRASGKNVTGSSDVPENTPIQTVGTAPQTLAVVGRAQDYESFVEVLRRRVDDVGCSRLALDDFTGLPDGYSAKLLGPALMKAFGMRSLGPVLTALGCEIAVIAVSKTAPVVERYGRRRRDRVRHRPHPRGQADE